MGVLRDSDAIGGMPDGLCLAVDEASGFFAGLLAAGVEDGDGNELNAVERSADADVGG